MSSNVEGDGYIATWGISDYEVEYYDTSDPCDNPLLPITCVDEGPNWEECIEKLNDLTPDSMRNECIPVVIEGELKFLYKVFYLPPFVFDPECFS